MGKVSSFLSCLHTLAIYILKSPLTDIPYSSSESTGEKVYQDALTFRPERWYAHPEMIKEASAYAPFSLGTYNCIGKPLALMILRTTLARLVLSYDISYAAPPLENSGRAFVYEARTNFITQPGPLKLLFRKRERV